MSRLKSGLTVHCSRRSQSTVSTGFSLPQSGFIRMQSNNVRQEEATMAEPELAVVQMRRVEEPQSPSIRSEESGCRKSSLYVYGDGQFSITLKHYDSIVSEVKCPGCAEPMDGPITMCEGGHSICSVCRVKVGTCPLCSARVTELRNYTLEAIVSKVQFPCKNAVKGCAVRLPLQLLRWHRDRCGYKLIECYMGKVWGGCGWHGCERDWPVHCEASHGDHVHREPQVTLQWEYGVETSQRCSELQLVVAYHVLRAHDESFNLYQVFDQHSRTVLWTMTCSTKESKVSSRFAFELELFSPVDSWKLLVQRFPCHSELDPDFLHDGHCAKIPLADVLRFMADDKVLHYRVQVLEVGPSRCQSLAKLNTSAGGSVVPSTAHILTDYSCKHIEHVNLKAVPEGNIICRKQELPNGAAEDDEVFLPYADEEDNSPTRGSQSEQSSPSHVGALKPAASVPMLSRDPAEVVELQPIQKLVRVRVAEREQAVKMQPQYAIRKPAGKINGGGVDPAPSCESLAKPSKATGLSKFYNVTMYKAAKFLDKKSIK